MPDNQSFLIVGLGNPGARYERNRHNIGFMAVDALAGKYGASAGAKKFNGLTCHLSLATNHLHFLKPQTFMNLSGESVAACARFYKIPPEEVIVLYDELDLPPGKLRVKQGGGNGGHNGLKSIDAHLGENYWRVRIGIGHPGDKALVSSYVLSDFSKSEWAIEEKMIAAITDHFSLLLGGDAAGFMNKVAATISPPPLRGRAREGGDIIPLARDLRRNMTDAEKKLWYHLRRENLAGYKFRRQQPLDNYIADFACLEKKLIVEVDGSQHADNTVQDAERSAYFARTGHKVLRFWNNEVIENIEGVLQSIIMELEAR